MKRSSRKFLLIAVAALCVFPLAQAAGTKTKDALVLRESATVGGHTLAGGHYVVSWKGDPKDLQVEFRGTDADNATKISVQGQSKALEQQNRETEVILGPAPKGGGAGPIKEIRFHKLSVALVFG